MSRRVPLGRLGVPEDLAGPAVFLASDMARYSEFFFPPTNESIFHAATRLLVG